MELHLTLRTQHITYSLHTGHTRLQSPFSIDKFDLTTLRSCLSHFGTRCGFVFCGHTTAQRTGEGSALSGCLQLHRHTFGSVAFSKRSFRSSSFRCRSKRSCLCKPSFARTSTSSSLTFSAAAALISARNLALMASRVVLLIFRERYRMVVTVVTQDGTS